MNYCEHPQWESTDLVFFVGRPGCSSALVVHRCRSCQVLFTLNGSVRSVKRREDCTQRDSAPPRDDERDPSKSAEFGSNRRGDAR